MDASHMHCPCFASLCAVDRFQMISLTKCSAPNIASSITFR